LHILTGHRPQRIVGEAQLNVCQIKFLLILTPSAFLGSVRILIQGIPSNQQTPTTASADNSGINPYEIRPSGCTCVSGPLCLTLRSGLHSAWNPNDLVSQTTRDQLSQFPNAPPHMKKFPSYRLGKFLIGCLRPPCGGTLESCLPEFSAVPAGRLHRTRRRSNRTGFVFRQILSILVEIHGCPAWAALNVAVRGLEAVSDVF